MLKKTLKNNPLLLEKTLSSKVSRFALKITIEVTKNQSKKFNTKFNPANSYLNRSHKSNKSFTDLSNVNLSERKKKNEISLRNLKIINLTLNKDFEKSSVQPFHKLFRFPKFTKICLFNHLEI